MKIDSSIEGAGLDPALSVTETQQLVKDLEASNRMLRQEVEARAAVEASLLVSERKYRDLVNSAIDGICIVQNHLLAYVNPQLCEMMESPPELLIGTAFTDYVAPEQRDLAAGLYRRMMTRELPPQRYETVLVNLSGNRLDVGISANLAEVDGTLSLVIVIHDITAQNKARQMAIENERLETVRTMARAVGSNFSNILSVINSYAASITDSSLPKTVPHESAKKIIDAVRHAADLTKRLLGVIRVSGEKEVLDIRSLPVGPAVQKVCDLIAPTLKEKNVVLEMQCEEPCLYGLADAGQLVDVLMNVFLNAVDAMPDGGGLKVSVRDGNASGKDKGFVVLEVADSGVGMTPQQVSKVFQPFFTTKQDRDAFGLGLSVAHSMVKSWGGQMAIRSHVGQGTCVCILMPVAAPPQVETDSDGEGGEARTVLLVDDHAGRRRMMVKALKELGHTVIETNDGAHAIEVFREKADEIDLTVIDWIMPGVDGHAVLKTVHAHDPSKRVLMTSGFSRDYVRSQIRIGAWHFLQKPFSGKQFKDAVNKVFGMKQAT